MFHKGYFGAPQAGDDFFFFTSGSTVHEWGVGIAQKWSMLDQYWPNMAGFTIFQSGP